MNIELSPSDLAFVRPPAEQRARYSEVRRRVTGYTPKTNWREIANQPPIPKQMTEKEAARAEAKAAAEAKRAVDAAEIDAAIKKYRENPPVRTYPAIEKIIAIVARHFGVGIGDIISDRRNGEVIIPRHVAMYLAKELTPSSYPFIGKRFRRDHSTVVSRVKKIERMIAAGHEIVADVNAIRALFEPHSEVSDA